MIYLEKEKYLNELIDTYSNMVYRLALTRTKSKEDSEDIYQEVFMRLSRKLPDFKSKEHEKAWLIRVTINCSKTFLNSRFFKNKTTLDENLSFTTPEKHEIYYIISELPVKYRTIIHLFYYENYKINEISKILHINENTIKSQLSRARNILKDKLKGGNFDE